jgi:hypothetical protein
MIVAWQPKHVAQAINTELYITINIICCVLGGNKSTTNRTTQLKTEQHKLNREQHIKHRTTQLNIKQHILNREQHN